jgi:hypothetical protein
VIAHPRRSIAFHSFALVLPVSLFIVCLLSNPLVRSFRVGAWANPLLCRVAHRFTLTQTHMQIYTRWPFYISRKQTNKQASKRSVTTATIHSLVPSSIHHYYRSLSSHQSLLSSLQIFAFYYCSSASVPLRFVDEWFNNKKTNWTSTHSSPSCIHFRCLFDF